MQSAISFKRSCFLYFSKLYEFIIAFSYLKHDVLAYFSDYNILVLS